ncbi:MULTISPECIES: helix-turn-helix domain-containing protein [unclassified Blautia]|uniref:PucR family transcriptional regulator n=1 Tax=unclassified Blautia TaxID=2648079 RepID=UPI003F8C1F8A
MRLSSVYLYEKIKEKYEILKKGNLSGNDGYLRPFLRCGINRDDRKKEDRFRSGHVYVIQVRDDEEWKRVVPVMKYIFWIFCKKSDSEKQNDNMIVGIGTGTEVEAGAPESFETDINRNEVEVAVSGCDDSDFGNIPYIQVALENLEEIAEFMNDMQEIFDTADGWERKIHDLMLEHAGMERLLQVAMTYILEQATRRLPGTMICHEGLLELKKHDEENQTQYMETLRVYLEQHLSATQAARELFIHRSTFLYRLDRIREILQSDLDDPEEVFYLELSFRLLEQEEEKE